MSQSTTSYGRRGTKRARSSTDYGRRNVRTLRQFQRSIPRSITSRIVNQRSLHAVSGEFSLTAATDNGIGFSFDTLGAYINSTVNGTQFFSISGLTELSGVYEILRLVKVEFTVMGTFDGMDIDNATAIGLPMGWAGPDYNDNDVPTKIIMQQNPRVQFFQVGKPFKCAVYPKMEGSNGVIDVGINQRNLFQQAGIASTQQWHGMKFFFDCVTGTNSNNLINIQYKCFFEGMMTK